MNDVTEKMQKIMTESTPERYSIPDPKSLMSKQLLETNSMHISQLGAFGTAHIVIFTL